MELITAYNLIFGTFTASTLTVIVLCKHNNYHFFNPKHNRYQFYYNLRQVSISTSCTLIQSILISSFLVNRFINNNPHTIAHSIDNILRYSVIAELVYYVYHRIIHTRQYYKKIHSMHHENVEVYPFDTFYMTQTDSFFLVSSLGAPILFLDLNYYELVVSLYIYITASYLEHSNFFILNNHAIHHKLPLYNFCIVNPVFDIAFGTYR